MQMILFYLVLFAASPFMGSVTSKPLCIGKLCFPRRKEIDKVPLSDACLKTFQLSVTSPAVSIVSTALALPACRTCSATFIGPDINSRLLATIYSNGMEVTSEQNRVEVYDGKGERLTGPDGIHSEVPPGTSFVSRSTNITLRLTTPCPSDSAHPAQQQTFELIVSVIRAEATPTDCKEDCSCKSACPPCNLQHDGPNNQSDASKCDLEAERHTSVWIGVLLCLAGLCCGLIFVCLAVLIWRCCCNCAEYGYGYTKV